MEKQLDVVLLRSTPDPDRIVALAARRCYSSLPAFAINERLTEEEIDRLIQLLRRRNHLSPFEHAQFTFSVGGISRALSHQLVRHRIASYSQESQRYVEYSKLEELPCIVPPEIVKDAEALKVYKDLMEKTLAAYKKLRELNVRGEDARYVFPNAIETKIVFTMNARTLFNFFEQRLCLKAQWEIRKLAIEMLNLCRSVAPRVFRYAGSPCTYKSPFCREDDPSCKLYPRNATQKQLQGEN
ncbi:MAG: FAD-dependent thymidylate synthase [Candidatus Riflebacteria bacterium]|nr:FAD-dependent thymidylate synthase [Candidatus Riflebacteria bacterium]